MIGGLLVYATESLPEAAKAVAEAKPKQQEHDKEAKDDPFAPSVDDGKRSQIQVMVEYVDLPHKALTKLMLESGKLTADGTALRMKVQELVDKNEARILETQLVICRSGERATTESIKESIYPTEYEPPGYDPPAKQPSTWPISSVPCAFETRNIGSHLEIEPAIQTGRKLVDLRLAPELIWHHDDTIWSEFKDTQGNVSQVKMPNFYTIRINTGCFCETGKFLLVAVVSPKDTNGVVDATRKVMVFVKCDIMEVGNQE